MLILANHLETINLWSLVSLSVAGFGWSWPGGSADPEWAPSHVQGWLGWLSWSGCTWADMAMGAIRLCSTYLPPLVGIP
jgi:hypothetical protein